MRWAGVDAVHSRLKFYINFILCSFACDMQMANHHIVVAIDLKICAHKRPIDRNEMNGRMLQTILKWKKKGKNQRHCSLLTIYDWRHSINFSFISMLPKVELPFTMIKFKWDHATIKWSKKLSLFWFWLTTWNGAPFNSPKGTKFYYYIYFEALSEFICSSHNSYCDNLTMSKLKRRNKIKYLT